MAADYSTPKGWMVSSMNRLYENETILKDGKRVLKEGIKKLTYEPIKNNAGVIVGFKDNTEAGGGKKYYSIKKYQMSLEMAQTGKVTEILIELISF